MSGIRNVAAHSAVYSRSANGRSQASSRSASPAVGSAAPDFEDHRRGAAQAANDLLHLAATPERVDLRSLLEAALARLVGSSSPGSRRFLFQAGQFHIRQTLAEQFASRFETASLLTAGETGFSMDSPTNVTAGFNAGTTGSDAIADHSPGTAASDGASTSESDSTNGAGDETGAEGTDPGSGGTDSDVGSGSGETGPVDGDSDGGDDTGSGDNTGTGGDTGSGSGGDTGSGDDPPDDGGGLIGGLLDLLT